MSELTEVAKYFILSKNSSQTVAGKIPCLIAIRIGMNKMAEGDEYLDYLAKTLERVAKPWSTSLEAFLKTKWWVSEARLKLKYTC